MLSYRASLTLSIGLLVTLTGVTLTIFSYRSARENTNTLAEALFREVTAHAVTQTRDHLLRIVPVARSVVALGERGFSFDDSDRLGAQLTAVLRANLGVTWISYSNEAGQFTGAYRTTSDTLRVNQSWIVNGRTIMVEHDVLADGSWKFLQRQNDSGYDPRKRPFYEQARRAKKLTWLPPYIFYDQGVPGITCADPLYDQSGKILGVLTFDFDLNALSELAADLSVSVNSKVILLTPDGVLLAHPKRRLALRQGTRAEGRLPTIADVNDPSAQAFFDHLGPADMAAGPDHYRQFTFDAQGVKYLAGANAFQVEDGPVWIVGAIAPQSDFLGSVYRNNLTSLLISIAAVLGAALLAGVLARRVSRRVVDVVNVLNRIGAGDLDAKSNLGGSNEFMVMRESLNRMTAHLRDHLRLRSAIAIAQDVQQQLLPPAPPQISGLDLAGRSVYCDETGGDYYDYLTLGSPGDGRAVIVIGDVVGHGIGSALLMSTARGVLRSLALAGGSLGEIVTKLNQLLVGDMRSGRFMTLCLASVCPTDHTVRWARAGHDPALVYDPVRDVFEELHGGSIPLGIEGEMTFEEYAYAPFHAGQILMLGTDGIWETFNSAGEMFGKERLKAVIRAHAGHNAAAIGAALLEAISTFRGDAKQQDDITFVVVKMIA